MNILFMSYVNGTAVYPLITEMRYLNLVEEQEHKFCTASNRKELLTQKLDRLRALKDEIAKDEWMFETTK